MSSIFSARFALVLLSVPLLVAAKCDDAYQSMGSDGGTESEPDPEPQAGRATGGSAGTDTAPSGGRAHYGGAAGAAHFDCSAFNDAEPRSPVTVRIVNDGAEPIYLGTPEDACDVPPRFSLRDATGVLLQPQRDSCDASCEALQTAAVGCPAICNIQKVVRIEANGSFEVPWDARLIRQTAMPEACYASPLFSQGTCSIATEAPDDHYVFFAVAWSDWACEDFGGSPCTCQGDESSCTFTGRSKTAGESRERSASLSYPNENLVEIRFE